MANINIMNGRTIGKTLFKIGCVALMGAGIYAGIRFTNDYFRNKVFYERAKSIEKAISKKDYVLAQKTLDNFIEKNYLKMDDADKLELYIKRGIETEAVDELLNDGKISEAKNYIANLEDSNIFNRHDLEGLMDRAKKEAEQNKEDVLFEKIRESYDIPERNELSEKYIKLYPEGKEKKNVLTGLLLNKIVLFLGSVWKDSSSDYAKLIELNKVLEQYKSSSIALPEETRNKIKEHIAKSDYLERGMVFVSPSKNSLIDEGTVVKYIKKSSDWTSDYVNPRDSCFPIGTIGKVMESAEGDNVIMEPSKIKNEVTFFDSYYTRDTDITNYWKFSRKKVAKYDREELGISQEIPEVDKFRNKNELERLENLLKKYQ